MFHVSKNLSTPIMNAIFTQKDNSWYDLRETSEFLRPLAKSVYHGSESVSFVGPKIWGMLPDNCKNIDNLNTFKKQV